MFGGNHQNILVWDSFDYILQYLRTNKLDLKCLNKEQISFIKEEAKFFNITSLTIYLESECK